MYENELNPTIGEAESGGAEELVTSEKETEKETPSEDAQKERRRFNEAVATARRQSAKETADKLGREFDEEIRALGLVSQTGKAVTSRAELKAYTEAVRLQKAQDKAAKEGRDVQEVLDEDANRAFIKSLREREKAASSPGGSDEFIARDIESFRARHPDVDIVKLDGNKAFRRFAGSRYGREPLADLYDDYIGVVGEVKAAEAVRREDRSARSTGSGGAGSAAGLTAAQRAELKRWNENYPEMKMTEAEFLSRA